LPVLGFRLLGPLTGLPGGELVHRFPPADCSSLM